MLVPSCTAPSVTASAHYFINTSTFHKNLLYGIASVAKFQVAYIVRIDSLNSLYRDAHNTVSVIISELGLNDA